MPPQQRGRSRSTTPSNTTPNDRSTSDLVKRVLGDPSLFPDEFKAWLPRWLYNNVNFTIVAGQLPKVELPHVVGATGEVAFQNSWVNFGGTNATCSYYKDAFGRVMLKGTVKSGSIGATIFTLPAGYRPSEAELFPVYSNGAFGACIVNPDGTVVANVGNNASFTLSGISFRQFA